MNSCFILQSFKEGKCTKCNENGQLCMRMGYHSIEDYHQLVRSKKLDTKKPPVLYLMTGDKEPFCRKYCGQNIKTQ